ncbi:MAG: pilus assembly protein [Planctomycetaceae bacterium]|nr:pilus assembly protein [Planctomycetaceae bacterium]
MPSRIMPSGIKSRSLISKTREGSATVEIAVCMPIVLLILAGAIEGANFAFLKQTLAQSAYEGIKVAVRRNSNAGDGLEAARRIIQQRNVQDVNFRFQPDPATAAAGTPITLIVSAPGDSNSQFPIGPFSGQTINVRATMARE